MSTTLDFPRLPTAAPAAAVRLLTEAEQGLLDAEQETNPARRFAAAYLCALRAAAAMLAMRGRPHRGNARPTSVWTLLSAVAPELREWAAYFAAGSATRASVQAGITRVVSERAADDLVRQTGQFLGLVRRAIHGTA